MQEFQSTESLIEKQKSLGLKKIQICPDGKYRWYHELNMWRNPSILFLVMKIFFYILLGMFIFFSIIILISGEGWDSVLGIGKLTLVVAGIFAVIIPLGYALLALIYGGKYMVLFEMDEKGVLHQQIETQAKKARTLGWLTALVSLLARRPSGMGAGMLAASRTSSYSTFENVTSVKAYPSRQLIKVNEPLFKNQVYVEDPDDFDFVYKYICAHCKKLQK